MKRVHLIGIGGTAMATLAAMLKRKGWAVQGSDEHVYPPMSELLAAEQIPVLEGYRAEHLPDDLDWVVVGNVISRGNPELEAVLDRRLRYASLPEALRDQFLWGTRSLVVAGTHGKTTTTALLGWLLTCGGRDPGVFVGGVATNFGSSFRLGQGRDFVIEGDEYDSAWCDKTAKFLKYLPEIAVVGNVEFDHADIYPDLSAVRVQFRRFVQLLPRRGLLLLGAESPEALALREGAPCPVETFGWRDDADWQAEGVTAGPTGTRFEVRRRGERFGTFTVPLLGRHNVLNALGALAAATAVGVPRERLLDGLRTFRGVRRRLERRGVAGGVAVYDDFAHHPTAVAATLDALRSAYPGRRLWAIFEPRSASACRRVFQDAFVTALAAADEVVVAGVYRTTVPAVERFQPDRLVADLGARGVAARYVPDVDEIVRLVAAEARPGDLVVAMSNGAFGGIHGKLLAALGARPR